MTTHAATMSANPSAGEIPVASAAAETPAEPRILDTYSLVYAFVLVFLVPGTLLLENLTFRVYTFSYVSLVTVPFVLGIIATFLTDSTDGLRRVLIRSAVLVPLIVVSGVGVLFTSAIAVVPVSGFIIPENFGALTWVSVALLALVASPLVFALARRMRPPRSVAHVVQALALIAALALVGAVMVATIGYEGMLGTIARKDVVIYIIGALTWYLPSFGLAAGVWRRLGLV
ncbi:MAG: hypothetical protein U1E29_14015 [Coriobacteriia bacterium]|nr:hypothetical protein [Coriobacteriia bacterium]